VGQVCAIIILGAAVRPGGLPSKSMRIRVEAALACGSRQGKALYIPTGAKGKSGPPEAVVMARMLQEAGVADADIVLEATGTDTLSSVRACARLLRSRGHAGPVFAATSFYHLPRAVLLLRLAGLPARACVPSVKAAPLYWWLREALALPYDLAIGLGLRLLGRL
jgi:uncharacterized SAM-binding protein YcdF (DUF218 family)